MAKLSNKPKKKVNVLFTCVGRRVSLLKSFVSAAEKLNLEITPMGTDVTNLSPALQRCDRKFIVEKTTHKNYIPGLFKIVKENHIDLLVPTVDLDLKALAENKERFAELGCTVLVSSPEVIEICQDKRKTYSFLKENGFETPVTISAKEALAKSDLKFPCFLKPSDGYASRGNAKVRDIEELQFFAKRIPNCICQEFVEGDEYTCDVYVDLNMKVRCVVPRKRIEVRSGEVSKAIVVKDMQVMDEAARLVEMLKAGPGVITLQLFISSEGHVKYIELNPRFGGGVPLSIKAGADFPKWILAELMGQTIDIKFDGFKDALTMLRYDDEVWLSDADER